MGMRDGKPLLAGLAVRVWWKGESDVPLAPGPKGSSDQRLIACSAGTVLYMVEGYGTVSPVIGPRRL